MTGAAQFTATALPGIPSVGTGDDVGKIIADGLQRAGLSLRSGDVLVVTHKIISKSEGQIVDLGTLSPSARAKALAQETGKDPRFIEAVLSESVRIVRTRPDLIIAEHRLGFVMANAGIDHSNVPGSEAGRILLLPRDPDASAADLRAALEGLSGIAPAVVISDSAGRAWRNGVVGMAIGAAGLPALQDLRGQPDREGRALDVTEVGLGDEIASAAELLMGEADEGRPVVLLRGLKMAGPDAPAAKLVRPAEMDLFR